MQNPADEGAIPAPTQALLHEVETIARRAGGVTVRRDGACRR